ncbi:hypothetical protein GCM10009434_29820 [Brevundimonas olei]
MAIRSATAPSASVPTAVEKAVLMLVIACSPEVDLADWHRTTRGRGFTVGTVPIRDDPSFLT